MRRNWFGTNPRPRHHLFKHLAPPPKSVRVPLRPRFVVHEAIALQARPLSLAGIFIGLELDKEERNPVVLRRRLAFPYEVVRQGMLTRRVVEHHNIPAFRLQDAIREQRQQEHATRPSARELDHMRQLRMVHVEIAELILLMRVVSLRHPSNLLRHYQLRRITDQSARRHPLRSRSRLRDSDSSHCRHSVNSTACSSSRPLPESSAAAPRRFARPLSEFRLGP